jgi:uncharacterized protein YhaN
MRIRALLLDRYGPFTDRRLDFRDDARLTVVHGSNEAGKSSALRGVADALYGIEMRSPMDFEHDYDAMRVGAELEASDRRRITFRRRKGSKRTLLDLSGSAMPDDALASFVGQVDRRLFLEAFGLNNGTLRAGGEALTSGEGSLGEALLAAAPGLGRLTDLRRALGEEADALFTPRRSAGKPFYRALDDWDDARRRETELTLGEARIRDADDAVTRAACARDDVVSRRRDLLEASVAVNRRLAVLPRLATIADLEASIAAIPERAAVDEAFSRAYAAARDDLRAARQDLDRIARELPALEAERAATAPPDRLLSTADRIEAIAARAAKRAADEADLRDTRDRITAADRRLEGIAGLLGLPDGEAVRRLRPAAPVTARAKTLSVERRRLLDARDAATAAVADCERRLAGIDGTTAVQAAPTDPRDFRARLTAVSGLAALDKAARTTRAEAAAVAGRLADALTAARLDPATAPGLRGRRLPAASDLVTAATRRGALQADLADAEARERAQADRAADAAPRADSLGAEPIPGPDALAAARALRAAAVAAVRSALFADPPLPASDRAALLSAADQAIGDADRVADARIDLAARFAELEAARRSAEADARALTAAAAATRDTRAALAAFDADFAASLAGTDIDAATPDAAIAALEDHGRLVDLLDRRDAAERAAAEAEAERDTVNRTLAALAADLGVVDGAIDPLSLLAVVRARVDAAEAAWEAARGRQAAREEAELRRAEAIRTIAEIDGRIANDNSAWSGILAALAIAGDAGPAEADAALATWADAVAPIESRAEAAARLDRLEAEIVAFDTEVAAIVAEHAPDLVDAPTAAAARRMGDRLAEARVVASRADELDRRIDALRRESVAAAERSASAEAAIDALALRAAVAPGTDLDGVVAAAAERRRLSDRIAEERRLLVEQAGMSEQAARDDVAGADRSSLEVRREEIRLAQVEVDQAIEDAARAHQTAIAERETLARGGGAESARQAAENALARTVEIAEDWRVLVAAERILAATIDEFRRRHQNPVLDAASGLFAAVTIGRYPELVTDYDDNGVPVLRAVRRDGRRLAPDALSEGTRDQLFLALRLATLLDHAGRAEPMPFLGDDLFVTFDEDRTAAGLEALALFGERIQAILFTHHEHVAAIAAERLGGRAEVLRL